MFQHSYRAHSLRHYFSLVAMTNYIIVDIEPIGKPRMTQRDKWAKRKCVLKYYKFKDELKKHFEGINLDGVNSVSWEAFFSIPKSWSKKKRDEKRGTLHDQKPDRDNIDKAILDSLFLDDSKISYGLLIKRWDDGKGARIEICFSDDVNFEKF